MAVVPMKLVTPGGYRVVAAKEQATIYLYGPIGPSMSSDDGVSANQFRKDLAALGDVKTIDVRINSEGGDVFDGQAIYSLLVQHRANVVMHIDGLAASAASFIAMAGNTIEVSESAFVMIHNASAICWGGAGDMRKMADLLETTNGALQDIYAARTKNSKDDLKKWMDDETWWTGSEALANGFADKVVPNLAVAASVRDPSKYRHLPVALRPNRVKAAALMAKIATARR
jgi:ATP-dependent Clp protease, protease subunit